MPSQFAWTKSSQERPQNKLQILKNINEQQAQEERRQSFVDSIRQDVELDEVTESAAVEASAGDQPLVQEIPQMIWKTETISPQSRVQRNKLKSLKPKSKI